MEKEVAAWLADLVQALDQINFLVEKYVVNEKISFEYIPEDIESLIRYNFVNDLKRFGIFSIDDVEDHPLGNKMQIITKAKLTEIISNKESYIYKFQELTKSKIQETFIKYKNYENFEGTVSHFFFGPPATFANFEIYCDLIQNKISINKIYGGNPELIDNLPSRFSAFAPIEF